LRLEGGAVRHVPLLTVALGAAIWATPKGALAERGDLLLGLTPSYAYVALADKSNPDGGGGSIWLRYHVTEPLAFGALALVTGHRITISDKSGDRDDLLLLIHGALTATYLLDLLPQFYAAIEAGIGILHRRMPSTRSTDFGFRFGLGVDYWLRPWLGLGLVFIYHAFVAAPADYPVYFELGPRLTFRLRTGR
jgi:hypothetical protein